MDLAEIHACLCDRTRLRIVHLLTETPLCVCHFQEILGEPQVKVSKHLAYLRRRGLVETRHEKNWVIYSLPKKRAPALEANLRCLRECAASDRSFQADLKKLMTLRARCCAPASLGFEASRAAGTK